MNAASTGHTVADLQEKVSFLRRRRAEIATELNDNCQQQQAQALKAALGDPQAKRGFDRILGRGAELAAQAAALDAAALDTDAAIMAAEVEEIRASNNRRAAELEDLRHRRLLLVGEVEGGLRQLLPLLARFIESANEIEQRHLALGGEHRIVAPLSAEAVKGRLAEFMAGLGYDTFLPLVRPEARRALTSLHAAEASAQAKYGSTSDRDPPREEPA